MATFLVAFFFWFASRSVRNWASAISPASERLRILSWSFVRQGSHFKGRSVCYQSDNRLLLIKMLVERSISHAGWI